MLAVLIALALGDVSPCLGVNIHFTGAPARDLDGIRDAGFGWVRMDFVWESVEKERGAYRYGPYDELVDGLEARGLKALFILDYSNRLYEKDRSVVTEEGRRAFARFAGAAAARYKGRGIRWEIWNEPNLEQFWKPQPAADAYAALAIEAARAIRAADPEAKILAPASSGFPWEFLERIFEKGILEHIDEVSVHPYRSSPPETVRGDYARLRALIARHAPREKPAPPVVSGEWGYSTWHHGGKPFSLETQGAYLAREFLTNLAEGIPLSIWYDWANDGPDPKETEHNFGTVTLEREPKPAYFAAKTLASVLRGTAFERRLAAGPEDHLLVFRGAGRRVLAAWCVGARSEVTLEHPGFDGAIAAAGCTGEKLSFRARSGSLRLALGPAPAYLEIPASAGSPSAHGLAAEPTGRGLRIAARRSGERAVRAVLEAEVRLAESEAGGSAGAAFAELAREVELPADGEVSIDLPVAWPEGASAVATARLRDPRSGLELAALEATEFLKLPVPGGLPGEAPPFSAALDGDSKVPAGARLSVVETRDPAAPAERALRLEYRFGQGWRFVRVANSHDLPEPRGKLSVWVRGGGRGDTLRARFRDARGETFQPTYGAIDWRGWKRVEIRLDGSDAGSWGGDGTPDPPFRWDSLFLVDSTREAGEGAVEFAAAFLVAPRKP